MPIANREVRDYQVKAPRLVHEALKEGHTRICVVSPTGTGKTAISDMIVQDEAIREFLGIKDRPINILFAAHRRRLLTQAVNHYAAFSNVTITPWMVSKGTIYTEVPPECDLVILDECHREAVMTLQLQLEKLTKVPILGLTATKDRADRKLLKFSKFIDLIDRAEAVEKSYLARSTIHSFIVPGNWCRTQMTIEIAKLLKEELGQTMIFCRKKTTAHQIGRMLAEEQLTSRVMVDISEDDLNKDLADFERKEYQFNISCMKLGEGVDVKGCQGTILERRIGSPGLLNQMLGRSARKDCPSVIAEMVDPLGGNLVSRDIITNPEKHFIWFKVNNKWRQQIFS